MIFWGVARMTSIDTKHKGIGNGPFAGQNASWDRIIFNKRNRARIIYFHFFSCRQLSSEHMFVEGFTQIREVSIIYNSA